jgi:hypothetical protein
MNKHWKTIGLVAVLALAMTQQTSATNSTITYNFTGTCTDCSGTATATLTVVGSYTLGTTLSSSNVVSFTYNGTNLLPAFTITPSSPNFFVNGSITNYPGQNFVAINSSQTDESGFVSNLSGSWDAGAVGDFGSVSIWGAATPATPAPSSIILLALGLAMLTGFSLWRRRRSA